MSTEEKEQTNTQAQQKDAKQKSSKTLVVQDMQSAIELVEKGVSTKNAKFILRALRLFSSLRTRLDSNTLIHIVNHCFPQKHPLTPFLLTWLAEQNVMSDEGSFSSTNELEILPQSANLPEVECFLHLLVFVHLIDTKRYNAEPCGSALIKRIQLFNRRMLDPISAKCWFYYSLLFELSNKISSIREQLLGAYRTACLHHNEAGQGMLINLILRNYIKSNQFDLADKFVSKTHFPETASNYQHARYYYYIGKLKSVQLDYTESYSNLVQAMRKAPQAGARAFVCEATKLLCVVQLLMGEIPERTIFFQKGIVAALKPYYHLTQAVRSGDLSVFAAQMEANRAQFEKDKTYTLIVRVRQNVIKTALRKISVSYSSISLQDVCTKLQLDDVLDVEYVVAKAIADGVIDATINHEEGSIRSNENTDIYSTQEPQAAFHKRIQFCVKVRNEAVKAMRYPENAHKTDGETPEQRRERLADEAELAKELAEEDEDFY